MKVTRLGDNGSPHATNFPQHPSVQASPDTFANAVGIVRVGDLYATHSNGTSSHNGNLSQGSPNVFVNGKPVGRINDPISCGGVVIEGSPDVFVN